MLLTDEEALARLSSSQNLANRFGQRKAAPSSNVTEIPIHRPGRKAGTPNITPIDRNEIAFRARTGEKQKDLAQEFNTTQAHVSQLERGQDKSLDENSIEERLDKVHDVVLDKLMESLNLIDRDNLKRESASGLARVASNLAAVVEKTKAKQESTNQTTVIVYAPELRKESSFKTIDI